MSKQIIFLLILMLPVFGKSQTVNYLWTKQVEGHFAAVGSCLKTDSKGNVFSTGFFEDSADFNPKGTPYNLISYGGWYPDVYISKYDRNGNLGWAYQMGGLQTDKGTDLEIDPANNIYICGNYRGVADFDPNIGIAHLTAVGSEDGFVVKLDSNGYYLWAISIGGDGSENIADMKIDKQGNLTIFGNFQNTIDFDPGIGTYYATSTGNSDAFVAKYSPNGDFIWMKQLGGSYIETAKSMDLDEFDNIYLLGNFCTQVDFDPSPSASHVLNSVDVFDIFLLKLNNNGDFQWVNQIGGQGTNDATCIKIRPDGHIYITGSFDINCYFSLPSQVLNMLQNISPPFYDYFIAQYDTSSALQWIKQVGSNRTDINLSMDFDRLNNAYFSGIFELSVDFDPSPTSNYYLSCPGSDINTFNLKLDPLGNFVWAKQFYSTYGNGSNYIEVDDELSIYNTGLWYGLADFDPSPATDDDLYSGGYSDAYIHKMSQCFTYDTVLDIVACDSFKFRDKVYRSSGSYDIKITNDLRCDSFFHLHLAIHTFELPEIILTNATCLNPLFGQIALSNSNNNYHYLLSPGNHPFIDNAFKNLSSGIYTLFTSDTSLCVLEKTLVLDEQSCCDNPFMPSAFSPNHDQINDEYKIIAAPDIKLNLFKIYNRFGNVVFSAQHAEDRWDGTFKGLICEAGTYFYIVDFICNISNKQHILKGDVLLLR